MADQQTPPEGTTTPPTDGTTPPDDGTPPQASETPPAYTTWAEYAAAHPDAKALHEAETTGLRSALEKEREKAKKASADLRELAKTADPATAEILRKRADDADVQTQALRQHLDFQTAAVALGMKGSVVEMAWALSTASGMSAADMKASPDLATWFAQPTPATPRVSAGAGSADKPSTKEDFNTILRRTMGVG